MKRSGFANSLDKAQLVCLEDDIRRTNSAHELSLDKAQLVCFEDDFSTSTW